MHLPQTLPLSSRIPCLFPSNHTRTFGIEKKDHGLPINRNDRPSSPSSSAHPSVSSQIAACPASCSRRCARGTATAKTRRANSPAVSAGPCSPGSPRRRPSTDRAWKTARQSSSGRTAASATASPGTRRQWNGAASRCSGQEPRRLADSRLEGPRRRPRWIRLCCWELRPWSGPWSAWPMPQMRCSFGICRDRVTLCQCHPRPIYQTIHCCHSTPEQAQSQSENGRHHLRLAIFAQHHSLGKLLGLLVGGIGSSRGR